MRLLASENGFVHVCGHRGHSIAAPENTIAALEAARAAGATSCEIDVVLSRDDEIVLAHDLTLDRTTDGTGLIASRNAAEIAGLDAGAWFGAAFRGEPMPTLRDVLDFARGSRLGLVVEIKERARVGRLAERLAALLDETGAILDIVLLSFDHVDLLRAKERLPGIRTEGITHARHADPVGVARAARLDSLSIELERFHPDDAKALHAAGVAIRCHLPPPSELAALARYGIDVEPEIGGWLSAGLIDTISCDDVAWLAGLVARYPPRQAAQPATRSGS
jgi:glycerophosphoryl diester phosphodiesterase